MAVVLGGDFVQSFLTVCDFLEIIISIKEINVCAWWGKQNAKQAPNTESQVLLA